MTPNNEWDKFGIRMSKEGKILNSWLIHESSPDTGFSCFDTGNNLVWIVKADTLETAINITERKRRAIIFNNLWGMGRTIISLKINDHEFNVLGYCKNCGEHALTNLHKGIVSGNNCERDKEIIKIGS